MVSFVARLPVLLAGNIRGQLVVGGKRIKARRSKFLRTENNIMSEV